MVLSLINFNIDPGSQDLENPIFSAQLSEQTVIRLKENFGLRSFHPFFLYGPLQNKILAFLLKSAGLELENPEQYFDCENADGVCVWPEPLTIEGVDLMILKLGGPADQGFTHYIKLRERVMMGLVMLSSVCCLCEENSKIIASIKTFEKNYSSISGSVNTEISKLVVFYDGAWLTSNNARVDQSRGGLNQRLEAKCRDNDLWITPLIKSLNQSTDPFLKSHDHLFEGGYISAFLNSTAGFLEKANVGQEFAKFASVVRPCFHPCVKAQCLMKFDSPSAVQLSPQTVDLLKKIFADIPTFCPFLAFGSFGGNDVLTALLKYARPDIANPESCFVECAADGVYVFPEPVKVGEVTLMLLLFRTSVGIDNELRRKITAGLTMFSSICCLCEGRDQRLDFFEAFQQDYSLISQNLNLKISKLEVLVEDIDEELGEVLNPSLGIILRDRVGQDEHLIPSFFDRFIHDPFIKSHNAKFGEGPYIRGFLHWTESFVQKANLLPSFDQYISELNFYIPPFKAQCLFKFGLSDSEVYSAELVPITRQALAENFRLTQRFCPVLVYGSVFKNVILEAILKQAYPDLKNTDQCFKCGEGEDDGVYVWPEPIKMGGVTLMLLKLRTPIDTVEEYTNLRKKVMTSLVMMTSVCCMSEEKSNVLEGIKTFLQDLDQIHQNQEKQGLKSQLQLLPFVEESYSEKSSFIHRFNTTISNHTQLIKIMKRKIDCPQLITLLSDKSLHVPYMESHDYLFGRQPSIDVFLDWTCAFVEMANLNLDLKTYVSKLPSIRNFEAAMEQMEKIKAHVEKAKEIAGTKASKFLLKEGISSNRTYTIDKNFLEQIGRNYPKEETVILVVLGNQGEGKSTFLNHIAQLCMEMPKLPTIFDMKNTVNHCTKDSYALSLPLSYSDYQIMLVDLEGLEAVETRDFKLRDSQKNLVSALLSVASVPCIIVKNHISSVECIRKHVARIAELQKLFTYQVERIHLLFNDIEDPNDINLDFADVVNNLNMHYFSGRKIIKLSNKPNFMTVDAVKRENFLKALMDDSLYPKKWASGSPIKIQDLLTEIDVIATNETTDVLRVTLNPSDKIMYDELIEEMNREILNIKRNTKSGDNEHLLTYFMEEVEKYTVGKLYNKSFAIQKRCRSRIQLELCPIKKEFIEIENIHRFLSVHQIKQYVFNCYESTLNVITFITNIRFLQSKLESVKRHFPACSDEVDSLLKTVSYETWCDILKYIRKSVAAVISAAVAAVAAAISAAVAAVAAAISAAVAAISAAEAAEAAVAAAAAVAVSTYLFLTRRVLRHIYTKTVAYVVGGVIIVGGGLYLAYRYFKNEPALANAGNPAEEVADSSMSVEVRADNIAMISEKKADALMNKPNLFLNWRLDSSFREYEQKHEINPEARTPLILLIGTRRTLVSNFANSVLRRLVPITPSHLEAFNTNNCSQFLPIYYPHPKVIDSLTRCYLICLRMKKRTSQHFNAMIKMAKILTSAASVVCLLVDSQNHYSGTYFETLMPAPQAQVMIINKNDADIGEVRQTIASRGINCMEKAVPGFDDGETSEAIEEVLQVFDQFEDFQTYCVLQNQVESLPGALRGL